MMMDKYKRNEVIFYAAAWTAIFAVPLVMNNFAFMPVWASLWPFLALFLVHEVFLSRLLSKRRYIAYGALLAALLMLFFYHCFYMAPRPHDAPPPGGFMGEFMPVKSRGPARPEFMKAVIGVLVVLVNLGVKSFFQMRSKDDALRAIQQENLSRRLETLRYQINPHFFMNTLNNIHALVDIDSEKAKESIEEFSKLMRIVLYEDNAPTIKLSKEIEYLEHFVSLMRLRYPESVEISLQVPENAAGAEVPPLLMASIVENAFKHGVSYEEPSFIRISISVSGGRVVFSCSNSNHPSRDANRHGLGMENVRRRLELMYGKNYDYSVSDGPESYDVLLNIPSEL